MAQKGDRYRITFETNKELNFLEIDELKQNEYDEYIITDIIYEHPLVHFEIEITNNVVWIPVIVGALAVIGLLIGYLSFRSIERIVEAPTGVVVVGGFLAAVILGILKIPG